MHVSLRLGPLLASEEEESLNLQMKDKDANAQRVNASKTGKDKVNNQTVSKKRGQRSPVQAVPLKRRRVMKIQNSPRRRTSKDTGVSRVGPSTAVGTSQPRANIIPATRKKGADFLPGRKPLS